MVYDVIIIGAGVVGGAVARELSKLRLSVLAMEKEEDVCCGISKANTGIIHSPALVPSGSLKSETATGRVAEFSRISSELGFRYEIPGALVLGYCDDDLRVLQKYADNGIKNYTQAGMNPAAGYKIISRKQLTDYEPDLSPEVTAALLLPDTGRIIPYEYGIALWENAVANGVELLLGKQVVGARRTGAGLWELSSADGGHYQARFIVNAAGHGSPAIGESAGFTGCSVRNVKGQYMILERNKGPRVNSILFQVPEPGMQKKGKGILVTRTVYGNIMIGPDARTQQSGDDSSTDMEGIEEILSGALKSIPSLNPAECIKTFAGVRPRPEGGDFIFESADNFIHLCGIESPGLTASPEIARRVVRQLIEMGLEAVPRPEFIAERRPLAAETYGLPADEVKLRVALPRGNGERLVCRCEQVPEARIIDALSRSLPVTTLDGVKRRTRAGQGRCQGTFCGNRVRELLSEKLGLPADQIRQRETELSPDRVTAAQVRAIYMKR